MLTRQRSQKLQTELASRGRENDIKGAPLAFNPSASQCRSGEHTLEIEV
jgi:hypothetical protein